ncbi:MFS family permease [Thermocatellispora tengchongensis]|uniref:MFS family permease n=1 Tax=Thermocatellispora tengchongensis TaxID=1073253 RepID=A0A840P3I0_9ACTN|nr:MFS transporter [Thermocatellispora tengchongensis]MBB5132030.1 MFS family permease [Thermocatellispora tengchongensis]
MTGPGAGDGTGAAGGTGTGDGTVAGDGASARRDLVRFGGVWAASLVSSVGSSVTSFVLGVWVFQTTGSATLFAFAMLSAMLPGVVAGPFAGVVIDRFDRRRVMLLTDGLAAASTAALAALLHFDALQVWHVYAGATVSAACGVFHLTAYQAMTPLLIPKRHLGRANGLMQGAMAIQIAAPLAAAALLGAVGMTGVLVLDLCSFAVAMGTLLLVSLPASVLRPAERSERVSLGADLAYGLGFLRARRPLLALVLTLTAYNFLFGVAGVLVQPLILSFSSAATLGVLMFAGGAGLFAGGLAMGAWGGPRRRVPGVALFMALGGVALVLHAPWRSPAVVGVAAAAFLFTLPVVQGTVTTVLQGKVEPAALGRVMGTAHTLGQVAMPAAYLLAAPLAESVLGPALRPGEALAGSLGALVGVGEERGLAAVMLADGLLLVLLGAVVLLVPALRRLEREVPDAAPSGDGAPAAEPARP